ncbi:hypothetical protein NP493_22g06036 [Ridgeia piscesae]|uniref:NECAP PHear domain-containing protein n=1 Tax=Ridgeia piscesae TaxID=27915 RepID=A0AAD9UKQ2_RIDPI|nr:hypothetical protein NP493_22g06036 [Ridgeia piscesae]
MAEYERVLCIKNELFVYRIPARTTNRGYRASEWTLDKPDWTGRIRVVAKGDALIIKLEDRNSGELFAKCPVDAYPGTAIEQVLDSSRYFVIRIQEDSGRSAFIGIGFSDRGDSFDLLVTMQDHFRGLQRQELQEKEEKQYATTPKLDLSLKEGQTMKLNIATKSLQSKPRPKHTQGSGVGLLPPPPRLQPPAEAPVSATQAAVTPETISTTNSSQANSVNPLLDFDNSFSGTNSAKPSTTDAGWGVDGNDPWGDFTSAT